MSDFGPSHWSNIHYKQRRWVILDVIDRLSPDASLAAVVDALERDHQAKLGLASLASIIIDLRNEGFLTSEMRTVGKTSRRFWFATDKPRPFLPKRMLEPVSA